MMRSTHSLLGGADDVANDRRKEHPGGLIDAGVGVAGVVIRCSYALANMAASSSVVGFFKVTYMRSTFPNPMMKS
jgi:hypothetical protein